MEIGEEDKCKLLWQLNDNLWKEKLEPRLLIPLEAACGVMTSGNWQHVLSAAFGRALETFQAVQRLCDPGQPRQFWADAFVLTRQHFEALVTLEWIAQDPDVRSQRLLDELFLKEAHILETLGDKPEGVTKERRGQIVKDRSDIEKRYGVGPGTLSLIPKIQTMVDQLAPLLTKKYPYLKWEYEMYYRDVSGFAHPSAWGLIQCMTGSEEGTLSIQSTPKVGVKALLWNGGWFLRLLRLFNEIFKVVSDSDVVSWQEEWARAST